MPDPDDLEAVRAEGRRLWAEHVAATEAANLKEDPQAPDWVHDADMRMSDFFWRHGPALLAPTLTEDEQLIVGEAREAFRPGDDAVSWPTYLSQRTLAIIDRLSGSTSTGGPTEQHDENCPAVCPWVGGDCYAPEHDDHACSCPASAGGPSDG